MKILHLSIFICFTILFVSCDPVAEVEFVIVNQSNNNINIESSTLFEPDSLTYNSISTGTKLIILETFDIGQTTSDFLDNLSMPPFQVLNIENDVELPCKKEPLAIESWIKTQDGKNGLGTVTLTIREDDF